MTVANGILCPACGSTRIGTKETRLRPAALYRRRYCKVCDHRFSTTETVAPAVRRKRRR